MLLHSNTHIEDLYSYFWVPVLHFWASAPMRVCSSLLQVCLVGKSRNYEPSAEAEAEQRRAYYIQSRQTASGAAVQMSDIRNDGDCCHGNKDTDRTPDRSWGVGFQPRDRVETVRNCAALPRDFVDGVVLQVANVLLGMTGEDSGGSSCDWNKGGKTQQNTRDKQTNFQIFFKFSDQRANITDTFYVSLGLLFYLTISLIFVSFTHRYKSHITEFNSVWGCGRNLYWFI